jgi:hypothetical protein
MTSTPFESSIRQLIKLIMEIYASLIEIKFKNYHNVRRKKPKQTTILIGHLDARKTLSQRETKREKREMM